MTSYTESIIRNSTLKDSPNFDDSRVHAIMSNLQILMWCDQNYKIGCSRFPAYFATSHGQVLCSDVNLLRGENTRSDQTRLKPCMAAASRPVLLVSLFCQLRRPLWLVFSSYEVICYVNFCALIGRLLEWEMMRLGFLCCVNKRERRLSDYRLNCYWSSINISVMRTRRGMQEIFLLITGKDL